MTKRPKALALELRQNTPAWIDARPDFVGSSDLPVLTRNSPYGTSIFSLWAIKTRLAAPEPVDPDTQELWDLGHLLEDDIAERYALQTGRPVRRASRMLARRDIPWASASLDRVSARRGERRIVEVKWVPHRHWASDGPEPVPSYVQDQIQWQLFVTGYEAADVAVLNGSHVEIYDDIGPNDQYQADLLYIARWFRELIERQTPPPIDGSEATQHAIARLHPRETLELMDRSTETDALAEQLQRARAAAKAAEQEDKRLRNVFRLLLGEHAGVEGDFYRISYRKYADAQVRQWEPIARAYRTLLEAIADGGLVEGAEIPEGAAGDLIRTATGGVMVPDLLDAIEQLHTETREGPRVLLPKFRNEEDGRWT